MRCALKGSVLGPLLFLIYTNDIANAVPNENVRLFADDTNLFLARNTALSVADAANNIMIKLHNWFLANKLASILIKLVVWYFHQIHPVLLRFMLIM